VRNGCCASLKACCTSQAGCVFYVIYHHSWIGRFCYLEVQSANRVSSATGTIKSIKEVLKPPELLVLTTSPGRASYQHPSLVLPTKHCKFTMTSGHSVRNIMLEWCHKHHIRCAPPKFPCFLYGLATLPRICFQSVSTLPAQT
jgi:hypothetical protein